MRNATLGSVLPFRLPIRPLLSLALCIGLAACGGDPGGGSDAGSGTLAWYTTCGDPVCRGYTPPAGVPRCTTEKAGAACSTDGQKCDPMSDCNALLLCTKSDPKTAPGGCPISRKSAKEGISYVDDATRQRLAQEIESTRLATYRYKTGGPLRLGFLIDDQPLSMSVDPARDMIDLYGYTSMAVAAIQQQSKRIAALEAQLSALATADRCGAVAAKRGQRPSRHSVR
ncbi:MAG TPA: hypothetical protein PKI03_38915 [Pseudomonadota bacterium]|nr:hypothetical protein [Pseudomonadota bacterium]